VAITPLVVYGRLVTFDPERPLIDDGALYIGADERIAAVQRRTDAPPPGFERPARLETRGCVYPGLIDLHNHIVYNVLSLWSPPGRTEPYSSRYQWPRQRSYEGLISDPANVLGALAGKAHLKYVEVKAVIGGVTAIQGSAKMAYPYEGWLVRNVEYETFKTGKKTVYQSALPLRADADYATQRARMERGAAFLYHVSEGTDPELVGEYRKLRDEDCLKPTFCGIHCTALERPNFSEWAPRGGSVVWSPFSNLWLYELVAGVAASLPGQTEEAGRDAFSSVVARLARPRRRSGGRGQLVLRLSPGSPVAVDRVLFLAAVHGPAVAGTSHESQGFLPVDDHGRVSAQAGIYAAGDATALTLKHSTLASSQATAAAEAIAAAAGADIDPRPWSATLYGIVTLPPHFPAARGSPWLRKGEPVTHCLWWPPGHVAGRHLAPYLASSDPGVRPGIEWHPNGIPVAVPVGGQTGEAATMATMPAEAAVRQDAIARRLLAIRRAEHEEAEVAHALEIRSHEFDRHEREVVQQLRAAGFLREREAR